MWFGRCRQLTKPISRMILDKINLVSLSLCHQELDTTEILHLRQNCIMIQKPRNQKETAFLFSSLTPPNYKSWQSNPQWRIFLLPKEFANVNKEHP